MTTFEPTPSSRLLENLLLFGRVLKSAGIPVTLGQILTLSSALSWIDLNDREREAVFGDTRSAEDALGELLEVLERGHVEGPGES